MRPLEKLYKRRVFFFFISFNTVILVGVSCADQHCKTPYLSLALYLCVHVCSPEWKWYCLLQFSKQKNDTFPSHRFSAIYLDGGKYIKLIEKSTDGGSLVQIDGKEETCMPSREKWKKAHGIRYSIIVTNQANLQSSNLVSRQTLEKILLTKIDEIPKLKRFDETPLNDIQETPPVLRPIKSYCTIPNFILANCRPLYNKLAEFEFLLRGENAAVDPVTEIWNLDDGTGQIAGYSSFLCTRSGRADNRLGGGVGIYVQKYTSCELLSEYTNLN